MIMAGNTVDALTPMATSSVGTPRSNGLDVADTDKAPTGRRKATEASAARPRGVCPGRSGLTGGSGRNARLGDAASSEAFPGN